MENHASSFHPVPISVAPRAERDPLIERVLKRMESDFETARRYGLWFFDKFDARSPRQMRTFIEEQKKWPRRCELLPPEAVVYALRQRVLKMTASIALAEQKDEIAVARQRSGYSYGYAPARHYGRGINTEHNAKLNDAKKRSRSVVEDKITAVLEEVRQTMPSRFVACQAAAGRLEKQSESLQSTPTAEGEFRDV